MRVIRLGTQKTAFNSTNWRRRIHHHHNDNMLQVRMSWTLRSKYPFVLIPERHIPCSPGQTRANQSTSPIHRFLDWEGNCLLQLSYILTLGLVPEMTSTESLRPEDGLYQRARPSLCGYDCPAPLGNWGGPESIDSNIPANAAVYWFEDKL